MYCMYISLCGVYCMVCWGRVKGPVSLCLSSFASWTPTVGSLTGKLWKSITEKNVALSRIKPGMVCSPVGELWGSATPAPVVIPLMVVGLIFSPQIVLYVYYLTWCVEEGLRAPVSLCLPSFASWIPTIGSLTGKLWKSTTERNVASSRIKPGMACSPGRKLWGSATLAPVIIPLMLLALYSVLTMYCMYITLVWGELHGVR